MRAQPALTVAKLRYIPLHTVHTVAMFPRTRPANCATSSSTLTTSTSPPLSAPPGGGEPGGEGELRPLDGLFG